MALHRLLFDVDNRLESANVGAYLRMGETGELVSYSSHTEAGSISFDFVDGDVTTGTDSVAETAHGLELGDIVQLSTTGTLPAGLSAATDYYIIRVDADNIKFATSLENAEAGTAVDITAAAGGGTHTVTQQERVHQALDVNIVNPIAASIDGSVTVTATDLDIRDLTHVSDSVKIGDGTDFLAIDASGNIGVTDAGGSLTVDAVDLDIRDLTAASDSVQSNLFDGAGTALTSTLVGADQSLDVNLTQSVELAINDGGNSLTVDAVQLDIDDLNATDDAVAAWLADGTGNAITSSAGALDVNIQSSDIEIDVEDDLANVAIQADSESVATTGALVASPLADRRFLFLYNNGNKEVYVGESGVSSADGFPIFPGGILEMRLGPSVAIHAVSASGTQDVRSLQLS